MKQDIQSEDDIKLLVNSFYTHVRKDALLAPVFRKWIGENWDKHLPRMYTFWSNVLFHTGGYRGNPMIVHQHIHQQHPLTKAAFDRWLKHWEETVRELFEGPNAENIIARASNIAFFMQQKL